MLTIKHAQESRNKIFVFYFSFKPEIIKMSIKSDKENYTCATIRIGEYSQEKMHSRLDNNYLKMFSVMPHMYIFLLGSSQTLI